ncbi:MAG: hypothetical protein GTO03_02065, partial [Planctomycetales bacterium]|nr:hypothetical protein [Planctomycetales bacterium]
MASVPRLFRFLESLSPKSGTTRLRAAAGHAVRTDSPQDLVVIISDLLDDRGFQQPL